MAASAGIPLIGACQDSLQCFQKYPLLELGSERFRRYLENVDFRVQTLSECEKLKAKVLKGSGRHIYVKRMLGHLRELQNHVSD